MLIALLLGEYGVVRTGFWLKLTELDIMLEVAMLWPPHLGHLRGETSVEDGWELVVTLLLRPLRRG